MKGYFSLDLETTGLDPDRHKIVEIACLYIKVGETPNLDKLEKEGRIFHAYVNISLNDVLEGDDIAINMNKEIITNILEKNPTYCILERGEVIPKLENWANQFIDKEILRMIIAGKNYGAFDLQFLKKLPNWNNSLMCRRFLDPSMYYLKAEDDFPPSLETCLKRAGLNNCVTHTAVIDAFQVAQLINLNL